MTEAAPEVCAVWFQELVKQRVAAIRSVLSLHHKLMSDIRSILKSMTKVRPAIISVLHSNYLCYILYIFIICTAHINIIHYILVLRST